MAEPLAPPVGTPEPIVQDVAPQEPSTEATPKPSTEDTPKPSTEETPKPSTEESKDTPPIKSEDPEGFQKRMNSLYGKLKGTEREKERTATENAQLKKDLEDLKSWKQQFEEKEKTTQTEEKLNQFKKEYANALDDGDNEKAAEIAAQFHTLAPKAPEQPKAPGSTMKERFLTKYDSVKDDVNFQQLATKINDELNVKYADEISAGILTEDGLMILLDREVESTIQNGQNALKSFSPTSGISAQDQSGTPSTPNLTDTQKRIASRLYQSGITKTLDEAYARYSKSLGAN